MFLFCFVFFFLGGGGGGGGGGAGGGGLFVFFLIGLYGPFKNSSLTSSRSFTNDGRKPENPGKNHLTIRKQNLANSVDPDEPNCYDPSHFDLHRSHRYLF